MSSQSSKPLTVMQLVPAMHGGGVERGTVEIARGLAEAGHRGIVVSAGGKMVDELRAVGTEHIELAIGTKSLSVLRHVARLRQLWDEFNVDIVHARSRVPAWVAWLAWRSLPLDSRPRFVTTVHGAYSVNFYSAVMLKGERVIAVSDTIAGYVRENYPSFDTSRLTVIHRGVDLKDFYPDYTPSPEWMRRWRGEFPELEGKRILTLAGRLTRLKGHRDLFELLDRLRKTDPDVHGLVVGGAETGRRRRFAEELRQEARERRLPVTFTGHRTDIRDIYAVSDVVLSLSTQPESFGRSVLEALAMGRPVLGYDHGGVGEILRTVYPDGAIGLRDLSGLTEAARDLLSRPNSVTIEDRYPLQAMIDKTLALYVDLADRPA